MKSVLFCLLFVVLALGALQERGWEVTLKIDDTVQFTGAGCSIFREEPNDPFKDGFCLSFDDKKIPGSFPDFDGDIQSCDCKHDNWNISEFNALFNDHKFSYTVKGKVGDEVDCGELVRQNLTSYLHGVNISVHGFYYHPYFAFYEVNKIEKCNMTAIESAVPIAEGGKFYQTWIVSAGHVVSGGIALLLVALLF